jgi:hypothetical protein
MASSRRAVISFVMFAFFVLLSGTLSEARAQTPQHLWSQRFGDGDDQWGYSVAVDGSGNVLVTGFFEGTVNFGGGDLTSAGLEDIFVAKFDAGGNHIWSKRFGDGLTQAARGVTVDGSGNVFVTGNFAGTVNFGGGPLANPNDLDIFVVKFDAAGNHQWSQNFGNVLAQSGKSVAVDGFGNVLLTGQITGAVDFGGGPLPVAVGPDVFVAKFDSDGNHIWSLSFGGGSGDQWGNSVTVDGSNNVVVTGYFWHSVNFGGGELTSAGAADVFVVKFDSDGNHLWSDGFGDASYQTGQSVAVDGSENVIFTGFFSGTVNFGGGPLTSAGLDDIFVAKFDSDGNHLWGKRFGDSDYQTGQSVAVDGSGSVIVTGFFDDTVDFGGGALTSAGDYDTFIAKLDAGGDHLWSQGFPWSHRFGGWWLWESGQSVAVAGAGGIIMTGHFYGTVDFGGGSLTSAGGSDIFVAKFGANPSPTLLQSYNTTVTEAGIEISWKLAEDGKNMSFYVHRTEAASPNVNELISTNIVRRNLSFEITDKSYVPGMTYRYRVDVSDEDGRRTLFETEAISTRSLSLTLNQNKPNPFNPMTTFSFVLPERANVNLSIFNIEGKLVRTIVDRALPDGFNEFIWDGQDTAGNPVSSGVYLYRLKAGKKAITRKMVLLK